MSRRHHGSVIQVPLAGLDKTAQRHGDRWIKSMETKARYHLKKGASGVLSDELTAKLAILQEIREGRADSKVGAEKEISALRRKIARAKATLSTAEKQLDQKEWELRCWGDISKKGHNPYNYIDPDYWKKIELMQEEAKHRHEPNPI